MTRPPVPMLEMLWEPDDPEVMLETRFNFSDGDHAGRWVAGTLAQYWGVQVAWCERIVMSDHNALAWVGTTSGRMLAKWSIAPECFPRLTALAQVTAWLDGQGLPVSTPVAALNGQLQMEVDGVSLGVQHQIDGDLLDTTDAGQVRAAGAVLARLHGAMARYPDVHPFLERGDTTSLTARVTGWLDSNPERVPGQAMNALRSLVAAAPPDGLPTQLVHGDFRSANVLYARTDVAAVIDFEDARFDHRIDELARSAVLLGTRFRDWGPVSPQVRAGLLAGYQSQHCLTPCEIRWWDILVLWYSLIMVPSGEDRMGWGLAALTHLRELEKST